MTDEIDIVAKKKIITVQELLQEGLELLQEEIKDQELLLGEVRDQELLQEAARDQEHLQGEETGQEVQRDKRRPGGT